MPEPQLTPEAFDHAVVAIALTAGTDHRLVYYNHAFHALFGDRPLGAPAREAFTEPGSERFLATLDAVLADGTARQVTAHRTLGCPAGEPTHRHFVYSCSPTTTREGPGILAAAIDTTAELHSALEAERQSAERLEALQRYEALIAAAAQMVWVARADGTASELMPGWEEITGQPFPEAATADGWLDVVHPQDRAETAARWAAALRELPAVFDHTFRVRSATGGYRHLRSRAVPVPHEDRGTEWIGTTRDIEDHWRGRLRERLLARAGAVTEAERAEDAFAALAATLVPDLTDVCAVYLLPGPDAGGEEIVATRIASVARPGLPPLPPLERQTFTLGPHARRAVTDRTPALLDLTAGAFPTGTVPEISARWLRAVRATSLTLLPIVVDGAVVALAATAGCQDAPPPGPADIDLQHEVLQRAQAPLRQALALQRARHAAVVLQRALLTTPPRLGAAAVAARYQPGSRNAEIGGDWYDAFALPDGSLAITIGDVAGHDLAAATTMGQLRAMLRSIAYTRGHAHTPADTLRELDTAAEGLGVGSFATAVHARLVRNGADGGWEMEWANAGHPPPVLVPVDGPPRLLAAEDADVPLCVDPRRPRVTHRHPVGAGETLLLYTDGLVEVPGEHLNDGIARLCRSAAEARHQPLADLCDHLVALVADVRDDIAVIAFRPDPQGPVQDGAAGHGAAGQGAASGGGRKGKRW
ncbi:SpoIIE family protein phosphatase [Kitasatospora sp. YST-16]|uniref:SpoIIE family protein phosphatase n=1 Tax=unclassified Kitasatospora TaxID=2633591 RepID=UPI00068EF016|nr:MULTISPECIES: SpoIIE family protein phosphatase [unclassified Kitasatospora]WAL75676.1 SpoIIE family protein phosphatase [Kitasatospora sp. YST-16]WNW41742.1 SpoIIE family protein phosphatase [Streptomyces sp. Li-HN-5-13]